MAMPKSKKRKQPSPSLDDKRWQTLIMAHHARSEQLFGKRFSYVASVHLIERLRSGELRCMRESKKNPSVREWVPASFFQNFNIYVEPDLSLIQIQVDRSIPRGTQRDLGQINDWVFYIWKPDYDKLWSPSKSAQKVTVMSQRPKSGPKPKKNWKLHVAAELHRIVEIDGKLPPAASYFADFCSVKLSYTPDPRAIQRLLKALL
jgi:hypothetical protein